MSIHKEIRLEEEICEHLAAHGWEHADKDADQYDRARALFPADLLHWVQTTQPDAWATLQKNHGPKAADTLLDRVRAVLDTGGTLDALRFGVDLVGLKSKLRLAQFKPAFALNPDVLQRYAANRLRVVRQVRYSLHSEKSFDLVLFLNGIPVATAELKSDFTQSINNAVEQYRTDRAPQEKGKTPEPLLTFPRGALVHFAVSNTDVQMTTKLAGTATSFLPFNRGNAGAKGNPPNPSGHPTAYLWEDVWARDSWLELLGRYLVVQRNEKQQISSVIFPRYHQLDVTRKLQAQILADGVGGRYLVQHSAGSGKTNSIAWTAHFLSELHGADDKKLFDSVIVVSDRNVIDAQLQETLFSFSRVKGVVASVTNAESSKSAKLAEALSGDKKIIVCTIQTFPFALEAVRELTATSGKRFAVIADEAHSSQSGQAAAKLKSILTDDEKRELADGGEFSAEDLLASEMEARAGESAITFVAFTATPKNKTLELFGTKDPAGGLPRPFHVYSMRQAIEEGFILDVLQNYTPYGLAFRLAGEGKELTEKEVTRSAAMRGIMGWVKLHPYNIAQKVEVVVEHFRSFVAPLLNNRAKAMVVVGSRKEAVRWQLAINKYITSKGYPIQTLVAFSGEVDDDESGPDPFSELSKSLNPGLKGRDIREAFADDTFQILLVANKFQTGFDQPLLCGMYVDKRLAGIQAVQTLSRLNRAYPGKDTTYVVDFANSAEEVLAAFRTYYETAELAATTDPNVVLNLRAKLDAAGLYDDYEIERVATAALKPGAKQGEVHAALSPIFSRTLNRYKEAQTQLVAARAAKDTKAEETAQSTLDALILFKADLGAYVRLYTYLSQIFDYGNTDIEKRAIVFRLLLPLLEFGREKDDVDLSKVVLTHHTLKNRGQVAMQLGSGQAIPAVDAAGSGSVQVKEKVRLMEMIEKINDLFEGEVSDNDKLVYVNNVLKGKLLESKTLQEQALNNSKEQFAGSPDLGKALLSAIMEALDGHQAMSAQALNSEQVQTGLRDVLMNHAGLYEELRGRAA